MTRTTDYFYIKNLHSSEASTLGGRPWQATIPARPGLPATATKEQYRAWCADPQTDWVFFTLSEGLTPSMRVCDNNPLKYQHGFVADYDAKLDLAAAKKIVADNSPAGLGPIAISQTFSGNIRLVWEFEEPLLLDNKALYEGFIARALKATRADKLLPHFDSSSTKPIQTFEIGSGWELLGGPIAINDCYQWLADAATKTKRLSTETGLIPFDRIAEEIERQFPGRVVKADVKEGLRVPLFWLNDGIDRIGAVLVESGVVCFSDRAHKSFLPWGEVLGRRFVEEFEAERTGAACADFWYDGKVYWIKEGGNWVRYQTEEMSRVLRTDYGLSSKVGGKESASEIDKALRSIQKAKRIYGVAPFLYVKDQVYTYNGISYLNVNNREPMKPASEAGEFPWLASYFGIVGPGIWDSSVKNGSGQRDFFLAWLQRFYQGALSGHPNQGHIIFLAGDPSIGKTFLSSFIMGEIAGGHSDAMGYLLFDKDFNKELAEVGAWSVDDARANIDPVTRRKFSNNIKTVAAGTSISYHPKFMDSVKIPWKGRLMITCNLDPKSLSIIPELDGTILDKIMLFKAAGWAPEFPPNHIIEAQVRAELPFFLHWLLNWEPPQKITQGHGNRYGVESFHHEDLVLHSRKLDAATHFREALEDLRRDEAFIGRSEDFWEGTAGALVKSAKNNLGDNGITPTRVGMWLIQLIESKQCPWLSQHEGRSRQTVYRITKPKKGED